MVGMVSPDLAAYALADFARDAQAHAERIEETRTPEVLTVNGRAALVVQDAESYQAMLDRLERAELLDSLRQAIRDADAGKAIPIEEAFAELDEKYGA